MNEHFIGSNYKISNTLGKAEITGKFTSVKTVININELSGGIYFIQVEGQNQYTLKFIKE